MKLLNFDLRLLILLMLALKQYQECNTLVTRIEVRIMRLRKEKGVRIKDKRVRCKPPENPNVPNNNTGIILFIIKLVIIYYSSSIENTASLIITVLYVYYSNAIVLCIQVLLL